MNKELMIKWIDEVFKRRGNYFSNTPSLLIMDSFGSHLKVLDYLKQSCGSKALIVPPQIHFLPPARFFECKSSVRSSPKSSNRMPVCSISHSKAK